MVHDVQGRFILENASTPLAFLFWFFFFFFLCVLTIFLSALLCPFPLDVCSDILNSILAAPGQFGAYPQTVRGVSPSILDVLESDTFLKVYSSDRSDSELVIATSYFPPVYFSTDLLLGESSQKRKKIWWCVHTHAHI